MTIMSVPVPKRVRKVYIAGSFSDAWVQAVKKELKGAFVQRGEIKFMDPQESGIPSDNHQAIYEADMGLIQSADLVVCIMNGPCAGAAIEAFAACKILKKKTIICSFGEITPHLKGSNRATYIEKVEGDSWGKQLVIRTVRAINVWLTEING